MRSAPAPDSRPPVHIKEELGIVLIEQRVPARVVSERPVGRGRRRPVYEHSSRWGGGYVRVPFERLSVRSEEIGGVDGARAVVAQVQAHPVSRPPQGGEGSKIVAGVDGALIAGFAVFAIALGLLGGPWPIVAIVAIGWAWLLLGPLGQSLHGELVDTYDDASLEAQWEELRTALTAATGREPGSSRPSDVQAGHRPDIVRYPEVSAPTPSALRPTAALPSTSAAPAVEAPAIEKRTAPPLALGPSAASAAVSAAALDTVRQAERTRLLVPLVLQAILLGIPGLLNLLLGLSGDLALIPGLVVFAEVVGGSVCMARQRLDRRVLLGSQWLAPRKDSRPGAQAARATRRRVSGLWLTGVLACDSAAGIQITAMWHFMPWLTESLLMPPTNAAQFAWACTAAGLAVGGIVVVTGLVLADRQG